jgi:hydrogenase expression/formation protein HypE
VAIANPAVADALVAVMRKHSLGREARVIGRVEKGRPGLVTMRTVFGTSRVVDMLDGDQLPRIC